MPKFTESIKRLIKNPAVSGTLIVTVGALIGSFFNYLLQFFLGRTLSVSDFGAFNALLSFSVILTVLSGSLSTALVKTVAEIKAEGRFDALTKLFKRLTASFIFIGVIIFCLVYVFKGRISAFLQVSETSYLLGFAFYMSLTFLSILAPTFLQGLLRFKSYSFWVVMLSIFRFSIPVVLVLIGMKVGAVYVGMGISLVLSYCLSLFLLKKNFTLFKELPLKGYFKKLLLFAGPVVFVNLGMTILNNIDVILVKHYFDPNTAGLYSGVVTLGKVFLFGAGTVSVVMYPQISSSYAKKEDPFKKLEPFLILQLVILLCGFLLFSLLPELVTKTMFGERYLPSVQYLPKFTIFAGFYVIANFFTLFLLAINKTKIFILHVSAALLQLVLMRAFHGNISQIIDMNIIVSTTLSSCLLGYFSFLLLRKKRTKSHSH
ncbi:MAG: oligosaccharide flippase family protein [Patescibacteria group bacterium]